MSVICEKVPQSEMVEKASYDDVYDFVLVKLSERPKDIPVARKWSMDPCFMPIKHERNAQRIVDFRVKSDDIWLVGFPKSGTNWSQELIWMICNNLDYERATKLTVSERFPLIEAEGVIMNNWPLKDILAKLGSSPSPRFIKSHLPCQLLPTQLWTVGPKIVYIARNLKDMVTSCYHQYVNIQGFKGSYDDFIDIVLDKKMWYSSYHAHVSNFFNMRNEKNILFLTYEDMKKDLMGVIRKTSKFFGKNYSNEQLEGLVKHLSFANISKNPSVNKEQMLIDYENASGRKRKDESFRFIRRGDGGAYLDEMPKEVIEKLDRFTESEMERLGCDPEVRKIFYFNGQLLG
ncbi:hypothetical protein DMENIID0001_056930 [Sergentomyia squamirostris]